MKKNSPFIAGILGLFVLLVALAIPQESKAAIVQQTGTNVLTPMSTNTFKLQGDVTGSFTNGETTANMTYIDGTKADDIWLQYGGFFTNTGAGASNIFFRVAQSCDAANWTNSAQVLTLVVPALSTNWAHGQTLIQNCAPFYGLRAVENTNASGVSARGGGYIYLKGTYKNGI